MTLITAVVLTKNEAGNIADVLSTLTWADARLVLDSLSTDDTVAIAQRCGATVAQHPFTNYSAQRNAAMDLVQTEWLFFVDADERSTPELADEVRTMIDTRPEVGWWVPRRNFIFGQWIQHAGWYPDYQLRVLKKARARYDATRQVHEVAELDGEAGHLQHTLTHYNYATVDQFVRKQRLYSGYEARILFERGVRPKARNYILQPVREFWRRYVTWQGYKDGGHGLLLSVLMAYFTLIVYVNLRQTERKSRCRVI
jgi:(heptosyl)LPS beta-1,4-glucosyltransferase